MSIPNDWEPPDLFEYGLHVSFRLPSGEVIEYEEQRGEEAGFRIVGDTAVFNIPLRHDSRRKKKDV